MARQTIDHTRHYALVERILTSQGLLLGSTDHDDRPNLMTIGWGAVGRIWALPMWVVLVRPSRYTHGCIERSGCFTVNVPTPGMKSACATCGSKSGRDTDKFAECGLTPEKASSVNAPVIAECPVVYECKVVHANDVIPEKLDNKIVSSAYKSGDFHRVYFGEIMGAWADADAADRLKE